VKGEPAGLGSKTVVVNVDVRAGTHSAGYGMPLDRFFHKIKTSHAAFSFGPFDCPER
jgi:hypothetical protein